MKYENIPRWRKWKETDNSVNTQHNTTQHNDMKIYLAGGESRHWLNAPLIENNNIGNQNENISGGRILPQYGKRNQADCMGGYRPRGKQ